ncbi:histidine triad nucleotide-binding protein [Miniphocaeibacter massiliensis]|uniref:histidine triad nucleotide-binding protein n=1 Tax=Miniphocaeibacter massiliensis TaxID=2041841 RepID=UPI000C0801E2|nr:histidine triad nucleotide-binding protein [Miniphocaeibacter massiliensis]
MDCIFCKIANGEIESNIIYEDEKIIAFNDLDPKAPTHFLVIPKNHISSANEINEDNEAIIGHIFKVISKLTKEFGFDKKGFRIVNNCGEDGGQTVNHIHFHVLAGRQLQWPPG